MNKTKNTKIEYLKESEKSQLKRHFEEIKELQAAVNDKTDMLREAKRNLSRSSERESGLLALIDEKNRHFPWLATAFSDYQELLGKLDADSLLKKKRPAPKAAERIKVASRRASIAEKQFRSLKYRIDFYEKYFPWIIDVAGDSLEEFLNARENEISKVSETQNDDPVRKMLSLQEYNALSGVERNQMAFDRWMQKKKTNWEVGRMYERFIGFQYEEKGYRVEYFGAIKGLDDLGRDLIVRDTGKTMIVQCKYWAEVVAGFRTSG